MAKRDKDKWTKRKKSLDEKSNQKKFRNIKKTRQRQKFG
jgi:hypothetical protein|tara:strand:- start:417 stop:533 length:117 start_codon:yes stop_codon:yes gene_type:complete